MNISPEARVALDGPSIDGENDETGLKYANYWVTNRGMASD